MFPVQMRSALLVVAASVGLGGCASYYDPYGGGYGSGVSVGVGSGGYYGGYGGYGSPYYGGGYGSPYYGWNNGYYYPGTGYYVYDRYRRPHRWTDAQRRYWESRRPRTSNNGGFWRQRWEDYNNGSPATVQRRQQIRQQRLENRVERRSERQEARQERRENRREVRQERRQDRRERRRSRDD